MEMFISGKDLDVVLAVVLIAGIAGFAVALLLGRRVSTASRLLLGAVQEVGKGGEYRPPHAVLPAELAGLSAELDSAHGQLAEARDRERALEASRRELVAWVSHDLRTPAGGPAGDGRGAGGRCRDRPADDQQVPRADPQGDRPAHAHDRRPVRAVPHSRGRAAAVPRARRPR